MSNTKFDFSNVVVTEFVPRVRTGKECEHDLTITYSNGRIERAKCAKCDYDVWS